MQNILKENSGKADSAYEEIRKRLETASVVGADETGAAVSRDFKICGKTSSSEETKVYGYLPFWLVCGTSGYQSEHVGKIAVADLRRSYVAFGHVLWWCIF